MTTSTMRQNVNALIQASLAVENGLRSGGYYSKDCRPPMADAQTAAAFDAVAQKTGRSGFAILISADGKGAEIIPLGSVETSLRENMEYSDWFNPGPSESHRANTKRMTEEAETIPYTQVNSHEFEKAKARSHEHANKAGANFEPQSHEGKNPVGDAVLAARQRQEQHETTQGKLKQARDSRAMRRFAQDQYAKNESFAEAQKSFWQKKSA